MRICSRGIALTLLASTLLAGCGGGGGGGSSNAGPVVSPLSFQLQSAHNLLVANGLTKTFTVSITVSGTTCSGSGSLTAAPATTLTTFEGQAALSSVSTLTITSVASPGCNAVTNTQISTDFFNSNFLELGSTVANGAIVDSEYSVFQTPPVIPTSVKVGDTGAIGTESSFTDSTKAIPIGRTDVSFVIEADTSTTAIVNLTSKVFDATGNPIGTQQDRFLITAVAALTPISTVIQLNATALNPSALFVLTYN